MPGNVPFRSRAPNYTYPPHQTSAAGSAYEDLPTEDDPPTPLPLGYFPSSYTHASMPRNQAQGATDSTSPQPRQPPSSHGGLKAGPLVGSGLAPANENTAAASSSAAAADTPPAKRNSAGRGR